MSCAYLEKNWLFGLIRIYFRNLKRALQKMSIQPLRLRCCSSACYQCGVLFRSDGACWEGVHSPFTENSESGAQVLTLELFQVCLQSATLNTEALVSALGAQLLTS